MDHLPLEPEAFTEQVAREMRRLAARAELKITGPLQVTLDDEPIDLGDLYRSLLHEAEAKADHAALLDRFLTQVINGWQLQQLDLPLDTVWQKIFPRIYPLSFFRGRRSDHYACQPFVNGTFVLYIIDLQGAATPVTTEQLVRWGLNLEQIDELARQNLSTQRSAVRVALYEDERGMAAMINTGDGYDASRLLLERLHGRLAPDLGGNFLVAIPTRDVFLAFPTEPGEFVDQLKRRVTIDYRQRPYPITDDLFLVTQDGVAGSAAA